MWPKEKLKAIAVSVALGAVAAFTVTACIGESDESDDPSFVILATSPGSLRAEILADGVVEEQNTSGRSWLLRHVLKLADGPSAGGPGVKTRRFLDVHRILVPKRRVFVQNVRDFASASWNTGRMNHAIWPSRRR